MRRSRLRFANLAHAAPKEACLQREARYDAGMKAIPYLIAGATMLGGLAIGVYFVGTHDARHETPRSDYTLAITFDNVEGLATGAAVVHRGVQVGTVQALRLANQGSSAQALCGFIPDALPTLRAGTEFWIVRTPPFAMPGAGIAPSNPQASAYISYSVCGSGELLESGARVTGSTTAPPESDRPAPPRPGDLTVSVQFTDCRGLRAGAPVFFRGVTVGTVTRVALSDLHDRVLVEGVIRREVRKTVTFHSQFWVSPVLAEPKRSALIPGQSLGIDSAAVCLAYATPPGTPSVPAHDGEEFAGVDAPADYDEEPSSSQIGPANLPAAKDSRLGAALVTVHTLALERMERGVRRGAQEKAYVASRTSPGVFYRARSGAAVVVAARTALDPGWAFARDATDSVRLENLVRIEFQDGSIYPAHALWHAGERRDLALVGVDAPPPPAGAPKVTINDDNDDDALVVAGAADSALAAPEQVVEILAFSQSDGIVTHRAALLPDGRLGNLGEGWARGIIMQEGAAIGIAGRSGDDLKTPCAFLFGAVPEHLRPVSP